MNADAVQNNRDCAYYYREEPTNLVQPLAHVAGDVIEHRQIRLAEVEFELEEAGSQPVQTVDDAGRLREQQPQLEQRILATEPHDNAEQGGLVGLKPLIDVIRPR